MAVTIDGTVTPTAGGVVYGDGTNYASTSAGTSGQALVSNGASAPSFGTLGVAGGGTGVTSPGTVGNVLTSTGSAWASSAPAAAGSMIWLSRTTASNSATVDIETTFSSTYDQYVILITALIATGSSLQCRLKIGGVYNSVASSYGWKVVASLTSTTTETITSSNAATLIQITDTGSGIGTAANFNVTLANVASTTDYKFIQWDGGSNLTNQVKTWRGQGGYFNSTAALTGVRFFGDAGNIASGYFDLYGIKKS